MAHNLELLEQCKDYHNGFSLRKTDEDTMLASAPTRTARTQPRIASPSALLASHAPHLPLPSPSAQHSALFLTAHCMV